jgi:hypothetical protein
MNLDRRRFVIQSGSASSHLRCVQLSDSLNSEVDIIRAMSHDMKAFWWNSWIPVDSFFIKLIARSGDPQCIFECHNLWSQRCQVKCSWFLAIEVFEDMKSQNRCDNIRTSEKNDMSLGGLYWSDNMVSMTIEDTAPWGILKTDSTLCALVWTLRDW